MSNAPTLFLVCLLALAVAAPAANAATPGIANPRTSAPTRLFFHLGGGQDFPINTQMPADGYSRDESYGTATNSLTCLPAGTPVDGFTQKRYTTYYGYSSPGYVEYNYTQNGLPRIHPERGLSFDVSLDPAVAPTVHWYITTFAAPDAANAPHPDPVIPNVVARATVRTGEKITTDDTGYNDGEVIAQGQTEPTTLLAGQKALTQGGAESPQVSVDPQEPGKATVYGFAIPLAYSKTTIPKETGFSIRIDLFVSAPTCDMARDDKYAMPNAVKVFTDARHRPGMDLAVLNGVRIEYMHPQFIGDDLVVHTAENSPWGNYDVNETMGGITLAIAGAAGPLQGVYRAAVVQRTHDHNHHTEAVDVTYVWPYKELKAPDGTYTITLQVSNDQGTAKAVGIAQFELGKDPKVTKCGGITSVAGESDQGCVDEYQDLQGNAKPVPGKASPGLELAGALVALCAVAGRMRRKA